MVLIPEAIFLESSGGRFCKTKNINEMCEA